MSDLTAQMNRLLVQLLRSAEMLACEKSPLALEYLAAARSIKPPPSDYVFKQGAGIESGAGMATRATKGSVFVELRSDANVTIGLTHSEKSPGCGLLRGVANDVVVEHADIEDLIACLELAQRWRAIGGDQ